MLKRIIILLLLTSIAYCDYWEINNGVVTVYSDDGSRSWSMSPSLSDTNVNWVWPNTVGTIGQSLTSTGTNTLIWGTTDVPGFLTDGGILIGQGGDPIVALGVAANGEIPIGDGVTDPVLATITGNVGIDVTNGAGSITLDIDTVEILGNRTWGDGSTDTIVWTWNRATGIDPTMTFGNDFVSLNGDLKILGDDLFMTTNTDKFLLVADGTNFNPVESTGDVIIDNTGAATIQADSVALTVDTTGNYVASVATTSPLSGGAGGSEGATLTLTIADADDDGATKGAASFDNTDFNAVAGNVTIVDDGHAHTGSSLSGIDISEDTNLAVAAPVTLTGDTIGFDSTLLSTTTWGSGSDFAWTFDISGTNPTMTFSDGLITITGHDSHLLTQDTDLLVWLRMDDIDGSGNPIDLANSGTRTWTAAGGEAQIDAGIIGKAWNLDGVDGKFTADSSTGLPINKEARTVVAWVRTVDADAGVICSYGDAAAGQLWNFNVSSVVGDGQLLIFVTGGNKRGTTDISDGLWHLVGVTFDPGDGDNITNAKLWVDAVEESTISASEELFTRSTDLTVGTGKTITTFFNGDIDDLRIYSKALTQSEWDQLYQLGTLDAMTTFSAAYFKEYVASRHGYFNNLAVSGSADFSGGGLNATGDILSGTDGTFDIGSSGDAYKIGYINTVFVGSNGSISTGGGGTPMIIFDAANGFFEVTGGKFGINTTTPATRLHVVGDSRFGDQTTNYTQISATGDVVFVGGAGLAYGGIGVVENAVETPIASSGVKVQVTIFGRNMPSNNITPDNAEDHVLITKAGAYLVLVSATVNSIGGAGSVLELEVMKNNGLSRLGDLHADRTLGGGGTERGSITLSDIVTLAVPVVATRTTYAFVDSNPDTITDSSNNFVADGFTVGQTLTIAGSTSNDGDYTIDTVAIGTLTLIATDTLIAESAGDTVTATGSETVELWIENETNSQNYIVEDVTLSLVQYGGT